MGGVPPVLRDWWRVQLPSWPRGAGNDKRVQRGPSPTSCGLTWVVPGWTTLVNERSGGDFPIAIGLNFGGGSLLPPRGDELLLL